MFSSGERDDDSLVGFPLMSSEETPPQGTWYTIGKWSLRALVALLVFAFFAWAMGIHDEVWGVFFRN